MRISSPLPLHVDFEDVYAQANPRNIIEGRRGEPIHVFLERPITSLGILLKIKNIYNDNLALVGRGRGRFSSYLDQVMNSVVCILQAFLKFSVQGINGII